jgi:N-acetylglucosaminyldiphosphoundecaprenol N-acetyl-beta-D-mannosaminyltransferase
MIKRTRIFDLDLINDKNFDETISSILNFNKEYDESSGLLPLLFTPNVDDVVKLNEKQYADLSAILKRSYYILPDGQPVIWASKLLGKKLESRLPGSELFPLLWKAVIRENKRVMVVAPSPEVGELLKKEYPSLEYYVPPFFDVNNPDELKNVITGASEIFDKIKPEYVFIGIRFPKQNHIALGLIEHFKKSQSQSQSQSLNPEPRTQNPELRTQNPELRTQNPELRTQNSEPRTQNSEHRMPLFLLMGASYEFYLNLKKRAPKFWQKTGMEWFYRFTQEPGRLFRRYFVDDMQFFPIVWREFRKK